MSDKMNFTNGDGTDYRYAPTTLLYSILIGIAVGTEEDDIAAFSHCLRKISDNARSCDLVHGQVPEYANSHASALYGILAKYITADDFNPAQEGNTKSLDFLSVVARGCTEHEAVYIYLFVADTFPDHRWKYCFRRLCPSSKDEWESTLLEKYLKATSPPFTTFFRMLFSNPMKARALSLSAIYILSPGEFDLARVFRCKLGTSTSGISSNRVADGEGVAFSMRKFRRLALEFPKQAANICKALDDKSDYASE